MANRVKMSRENRAKQFMPFAALTGHREVLALREKVVVEKTELSEEMKEELNWKVKQLEKGSMASLEYFDGEQYLHITGMVTGIDFDRRIIWIVNKAVAFDHIRQLEWEIFD